MHASKCIPCVPVGADAGSSPSTHPHTHRRCLISAEQSCRTNPLLSVCRYGPQMKKSAWVQGEPRLPATNVWPGELFFPISLLRTRGILAMVFVGDGAWRAVALPFARCRIERGRILLCWVNVLRNGGSRKPLCPGGCPRQLCSARPARLLCLMIKASGFSGCYLGFISTRGAVQGGEPGLSVSIAPFGCRLSSNTTGAVPVGSGTSAAAVKPSVASGAFILVVYSVWVLIWF